MAEHFWAHDRDWLERQVDEMLPRAYRGLGEGWLERLDDALAEEAGRALTLGRDALDDGTLLAAAKKAASPWWPDPWEEPCEELVRLRGLLDAEGIGWADHSREESPHIWRIHAADGDPYFSAICGAGTYGSERGLLELWFGEGEPTGYLSAEEALAEIKLRRARG